MESASGEVDRPVIVVVLAVRSLCAGTCVRKSPDSAVVIRFGAFIVSEEAVKEALEATNGLGTMPIDPVSGAAVAAWAKAKHARAPATASFALPSNLPQR